MTYIGNVKINKLFQQLNGKAYYFMKHKATGKYVYGVYSCDYQLPDRQIGTGKYQKIDDPNVVIDEKQYYALMHKIRHNAIHPARLYNQIYEPASISVVRTQESYGDFVSLTISNYADVRSHLTKAKNYRKRLIKNNVIFLDDENKEKFDKLNFKKMTDAEILDFVTKIYKEEVPYFKKHTIGVLKTETLGNAHFYENPARFFYVFFEKGFTNSMDSQMSAILPRVQEILDMFEVHKVEFGVKEDKIVDAEQLSTDLTVSIIETANKNYKW